TGLWGWLTTVDHKRIGILYGATAFVYLLIGGFEALLLRIQLFQPNSTFLGADAFNQLFTMHGTTMIFLFVMPLSAAFFNFCVPLMIGARDVAFPRLNAFSYWTFLSGGLLLHASFLFGGAPSVGWFAYANLTSKTHSPGPGVDFWLLALQVLGVASLAAAFNFIVTIVNLRAPGMTLMRMPTFAWMTLVTSFLLVAAFPVITVGLILLMFDRFFGANFYNVAANGDPVLWQHLFWIFGHPEVYILVLPAMGIVSEVLPSFSRKPLFGRPFVIYSGMAIGFLGFGVWAHHMFAVGLGPVADAVFGITTMLIAVPTGVTIFNWLGTLWGGHLNLKTPLYFAVGFIGMFIIGGLSGVMHASPPADLQQTDTYFIVAHFHYVLFGGALMGLFAGVYYWYPKVTGRLLDDRLGQLNFWLLFIGQNLTFFPMHFSGLLGMPRRVYTYGPELQVTSYNQVSTIGAFILGVGMLVFLHNAIVSLRRGEVAGSDPWDAATLEWAIPSPPPAYNFLTLPVVTSSRPLWDQKYPMAAEDGPGGGHGNGQPGQVLAHTPAVTLTREEAHAAPRGQGAGGAVVPPADPHPHPLPAGEGTASSPLPVGEGRGEGPPRSQEEGAHAVPSDGHAHHIHMPSPSFWPPVTAVGILVIASGLLAGYPLAALGAVILLAGIFGWAFEPPA
ncbi:MAG: cytochrome c oxidase subunit I, partial [Chloroflexi bacterium]|nr:cytochrome c oxidase subunit I [Chloroflexota bacterium]